MTTITTRTDLSKLNSEQRKAVLSKEKRTLVLAGAGSGKTKTLLQKIHYLINVYVVRLICQKTQD